MIKSKSGFTLVELAISITVIAILVTITAIAYNGIQARARDSKRISDLTAIAEAIALHNIKYGNDVQVGSGCGSSGNGNGWFNYEGSTYPKSTLHCLTDKGYLDESFVDPYGCTTTSGSSTPYPAGTCKKSGYAYMKYSSGSGDNTNTCVYAHLESRGDTADVRTSSCPNAATLADPPYNMNYFVKVKY